MSGRHRKTIRNEGITWPVQWNQIILELEVSAKFREFSHQHLLLVESACLCFHTWESIKTQDSNKTGVETWLSLPEIGNLVHKVNLWCALPANIVKIARNFVARFIPQQCSGWLVWAAGSAAADWLLTAPTSRSRGRRSLTWPAWRCHTSHTLEHVSRVTWHQHHTRVWVTELRHSLWVGNSLAKPGRLLPRVTCHVPGSVWTWIVVMVGAEEIWLMTRGAADPAPDKTYK